jgi:hypothetical protein
MLIAGKEVYNRNQNFKKSFNGFNFQALCLRDFRGFAQGSLLFSRRRFYNLTKRRFYNERKYSYAP